MSRYDDIINLERPKSNHMKMNIKLRAGIFAPFAALTGYKEALLEEEKVMDNKIDISIDKEEEINDKLLNVDLESIYDIVYFKKDVNKDGGKYLTIRKKVRRLDLDNKYIILLGGIKIPFSDIYDIKKVP